MQLNEIEKTIHFLTVQKQRFEQRLKEVEQAITAVQNLCEHNYQTEGHDSHYDYEKCQWCQKTIKV